MNIVNRIFYVLVCLTLELTLISCAGGGSGSSGVDKAQLIGSWQTSSLLLKGDDKPRSADAEGYIDFAPKSTAAGPDLQKTFYTFEDYSKITVTNIVKAQPDHSGVIAIEYRTEGSNKMIIKFTDVAAPNEVRTTIRAINRATLELVDDDNSSVTTLTRVDSASVKTAQKNVAATKANSLPIQTLSMTVSGQNENGEVIQKGSSHSSQEGHVICDLANNKSLLISWQNKDSDATETINLDLTWPMGIDEATSTPPGHIIETGALPHGQKSIFSAKFAAPTSGNITSIANSSKTRCDYDFTYSSRHLKGTYLCVQVESDNGFIGNVSGTYDCLVR